MRELFDDELKRRLGGYKETPADELWGRIVAEIPSVSHVPAWTRWLPRMATVTTVLALVVALPRWYMDRPLDAADEPVIHQQNSSGPTKERYGYAFPEATDEDGHQDPSAKAAENKPGLSAGSVHGTPGNAADGGVPEKYNSDNTLSDADTHPAGRATKPVPGSNRKNNLVQRKATENTLRGSGNVEQNNNFSGDDTGTAAGRVTMLADGKHSPGHDRPAGDEDQEKGSGNSEAEIMQAPGDHTAGPDSNGSNYRTTGATGKLIDERNGMRAGQKNVPAHTGMANDGHGEADRTQQPTTVNKTPPAVSKSDSTVAVAVTGRPAGGVMKGGNKPGVANRHREAGRPVIADTLSVNKADSVPVLLGDKKKGEPGAESTSEERNDKQGLLRRGDIYLVAMPTFGYYRVEANKTDDIIIESIERIPNFSLKRLGVRLEAGIEYPVTNRLQLTGGILYYQRKQTIGYTERVTDSVTVASGGDMAVDLDAHYSYAEKSFEYELRNAGIHIGVNYKLAGRSFLHTVGTGVEFHKALNKRPDQAEALASAAHTYAFYNLYYRLQYPAEGRLKAVLQPTLNYSFYVSNDVNTPFYVKPYGLGLNIGVTYSLFRRPR